MKYAFFLIGIILFIIFLPWLDFSKTLSAGDWPYLYPQNIKAFSFPLSPPFLWVETYYDLTAKLGLQVFHLPWEVIERLFWFFPFLALSVYSSWVFAKRFLKNNPFASLCILIFTTNTYILMMTGGGQMGVAIAYALAPLVFSSLFNMLEVAYQKNLKKLGLLALLLGVQLMFDPRIFLITIFSFFIVFFIYSFMQKKSVFVPLKFGAIVFLGALLLNLFWIFPNLFFFQSEYAIVNSAITVTFYSFANFSNAIGLLQPNWPENLFGKVYFMRPEFLFLPVLAFSSLFFLSKLKKGQMIIPFAMLGLVGIFLSKGTNPPFGELYLVFSKLPGSTLFRDPTKFYILIILSYMLLIPLSLEMILQKVSKSRPIFSILYSLFLLFWLFTIRQAAWHQLTGTFMPQAVPTQYKILNNFLEKKPQATLWIPSYQRFGINTKQNPAYEGSQILDATNSAQLLSIFKTPKAQKTLVENNVAYIIVPFDSRHEIYLNDNKYDPTSKFDIIAKLKTFSWLEEVTEVDPSKKIIIFAVKKE
ncbi:MAG TPA: hypothetical protein VLF68_01520 [Candidatus Saccharimonadales bacterium]|nr:hypothetical protein [Candidatus Saccharimonadales bacterium]